jgi:hypothetical protein
MLPKLQEYFNDDTLCLTPKCHTFDYIGKNKFIEIKKRNFNSDKYKDTMIGVNKIEYCKGKEAEYAYNEEQRKELVIKLHDNVIEYKFLAQAGLIRLGSQV